MRAATIRLLVLIAVLVMPLGTVRAEPSSALTLDLGGRQQYGVASLGSLLFLAGGLRFDSTRPPGRSFLDSDEVNILDSDTGQWSTAQLSAPRAGVATAVVASQVLFAGGYDHDPQTGMNRSSAVVDLYDTATGQWQAGALAEDRTGITVAVVGTQVLFAGGSSYPVRGFSQTVDIYDSSDGSWSRAQLSRGAGTFAFSVQPQVQPSQVGELAPLTAWTVGSQVVFMEHTGSTPGEWSVDRYDSATGNWTNEASPLDQVTKIVAAGDRLVLLGKAAGNTMAAVFDAGSSAWTTAPVSHTHAGGVAATLGDSVVFAGGSGSSSTSAAAGCSDTDAVDIYSVSNHAWSTARLSQSRAEGMAVVAVAGKLVIAGGVGCTALSDRLDILDSANGAWTSSALSEGRAYMTPVAIGSLALLAGGVRQHGTWSYGEASDAVDLYDAATHRLTSARLAAPRVTIAGGVLGNRVFLAGGERPPFADRQPFEASDLIDIYDADKGTWSIDHLSSARVATVLAHTDGSVAFGTGRLDCVGCGGGQVHQSVDVLSDR